MTRVTLVVAARGGRTKSGFVLNQQALKSIVLKLIKSKNIIMFFLLKKKKEEIGSFFFFVFVKEEEKLPCEKKKLEKAVGVGDESRSKSVEREEEGEDEEP